MSSFLSYGEVAIQDFELSVSNLTRNEILRKKLKRYGIVNLNCIVMLKKLHYCTLFLWERYPYSIPTDVMEDRILNGWCKINM